MAKLHVFLKQGVRLPSGRERLDVQTNLSVLDGDASQFQLTDYGVVWWEGGVGQEAAIWPWHQVSHVMLDRGAAEEMGLKPPI